MKKGRRVRPLSFDAVFDAIRLESVSFGRVQEMLKAMDAMKSLIHYWQCNRGSFAVENIILTTAIGGLVVGILSSDLIKDAELSMWENLFARASEKSTF